MEIITARTFPSVIIVFDTVYLLFFLVYLIIRKKYRAVIVGLLAGVLYFIVDYGIFMSLLKTRTVNGASSLGVLLWLSMSYGFTNFVWIWLLLEEPRQWLEWSLFPILGWFCTGLLAVQFGSNGHNIQIQRGTLSYHGVMALILAIGYLILIIDTLSPRNERTHPIGRLILIGIGVQFSWELALLLCGIRPPGWRPLVINSLIETNLGMPYIYLIFRTMKKKPPRYTEAN